MVYAMFSFSDCFPFLGHKEMVKIQLLPFISAFSCQEVFLIAGCRYITGVLF